MSTLKCDSIKSSDGNTDLLTLSNGAVSGVIGGRRNLIINGAMQVAQRGTSETGVTTSKYANAPDRFKAYLTTAGTWTLSQSTTAPDNFSTSYKWACTTADASLAAGDSAQLATLIEAQDLQSLGYGTASAKDITVSFWTRSAKTGTYIFEIYQEDSGRSISASYTISSANTWEYKTIVITGDASGTINNDNGSGLNCIWWLAAGTDYTSGALQTSWGTLSNTARAVGQVNLADSTSNDWYITGVQLEVGSVATPFEHRSYGEELALCQRYYEICHAIGNGYGVGGAYASLDMKVEKRAAPSFPTYTASGYTYNWTFIGLTSTGTSQSYIYGTSSSGGYRIWYYNIGVDAEL